jgi:hypothetical protein
MTGNSEPKSIVEGLVSAADRNECWSVMLMNYSLFRSLLEGY